MGEVTRRRVLEAGMGATAAAAVTGPAIAAGERYDVAVIGAGVFGTWTAHALQRAGKRVRAGRRLGAGARARHLGRGVAGDARRLWRRRDLHPHGARTR